MSANGKVLFVLTSHDQLGETAEKTGFHYEEMSTPYYVLQDGGVEVELASIKGGNPPADPGSLKEDESENPESVQRFRKDKDALEKLKNTKKIEDADPKAYDAVFLPGGHGTMWDFPKNEALINVLGTMFKNGKPVSAVCHGPAGFVNVKRPDGEFMVKGKRVNAFTDAEECKVNKETVVPFMLETRLKNLGAEFEGTEPFKAICVEDGNLITGQNPPSAKPVAEAILKAVKRAKQKRAA